jgi:RNase adaptor protein for sRNA GlmZ degradation
MKKNKIIKLVYDKYENEVGILYDVETNEIENDLTKIVEHLPTKINDIDINTDRVICINTWGIKKPFSVECDVIFDLTKFQTKIDTNIDVQTITGLSNIIQDSIIRHPKFLNIIEKVVDIIETENSKDIGFICNHGKHRSVGWAELLKKIYYKNAKIKHLCRKYF